MSQAAEVVVESARFVCETCGQACAVVVESHPAKNVHPALHDESRGD